nr:urea transporter [Methylobacterium radiodurans]
MTILGELTSAARVSRPGTRISCIAASIPTAFGQVFLQGESSCGFVVMIGLFCVAPTYGLCAILGAATASTIAKLFGSPSGDLRSGLYGFNGVLIAIALGGRLEHDATLAAWIVATVAFCTSGIVCLKRRSVAWSGILTSPFVVATWFVSALSEHLDRTLHIRLDDRISVAASSSIGLSPTDVWMGVLDGLSQILLVRNAWMGMVILIALRMTSGPACGWALIGSVIGLTTAWSFGADPAAVRDGLYGYNAALTAIALGGSTRLTDFARVSLVVVASIATTGLYAGAANTFAGFGLPILTLPFVLTVWACRSVERLSASCRPFAHRPKG